MSGTEKTKSYFKKINESYKNFSQKHWFWSNVILAFIIVFVIEFFNRVSLFDTLKYMIFYFPSALMNILIVLIFLMLPPLSKRHIYWKYFICVIFILMGIINFGLFRFRMLPFNYTDILLIPSTISVIPVYLSVWQICLVVLVLVALISLFVIVYRKTPEGKSDIKKSIKFFTLVFVLSFLYYLFASYTGAIDNRVSGLKNKYYHNGFLYCFTSSAIDRGMREPEEYSVKKVTDIVRDINEGKKNDSVKSNIIFLQLESFFDVNYIQNYKYSQNPVPVFSELKKSYSHGFLNVPTFSAGTVNTEFEILTAMNIDFFGIGEYPYRTVIEDKATDSAPFCLRNIGYKSHAIHNNTAIFYKRNIIYSNLGFDTFTSLEYMYDVEYNKMGWAKDMTLTTSILDCMDSTEEPDLIYAVGVQTHGAYPTEKTGPDYEITIDGIEDEPLKNSYEYYVNQIYEVDAFIGSLISELEMCNEPTTLVVFGDHMPGFELEEENLYNKNIYQTEYVIWSNFDADMVIKNLETYQLYPYVLERINIPGGTMSKFHQKHSYKETPEYMSEFELIQYDLIYGEKVGFGGNQYEPTMLQLGIRPIKLENINDIADKVYVHGVNFNEYSWVFVNDERVDTKFINSDNLYVEKGVIQKGDKVCVSQLDENSEVLSSTNTIVYK